MMKKMDEFEVCYGMKGSIVWSACDIDLLESVHCDIDDGVYHEIYRMREGINSLVYDQIDQMDWSRDI
jgi:hypothetical protein